MRMIVEVPSLMKGERPWAIYKISSKRVALQRGGDYVLSRIELDPQYLEDDKEDKALSHIMMNDGVDYPHFHRTLKEAVLTAELVEYKSVYIRFMDIVDRVELKSQEKEEYYEKMRI